MEHNFFAVPAGKKSTKLPTQHLYGKQSLNGQTLIIFEELFCGKGIYNINLHFINVPMSMNLSYLNDPIWWCTTNIKSLA